MLLRLQKFNLDVKYKRCTEVVIADTDLDLMHIRLYQQLDHDVFLQDLETVDHKEYLSVTKARFEQIRKEVNAD